MYESDEMKSGVANIRSQPCHSTNTRIKSFHKYTVARKLSFFFTWAQRYTSEGISDGATFLGNGDSTKSNSCIYLYLFLQLLKTHRSTFMLDCDHYNDKGKIYGYYE